MSIATEENKVIYNCNGSLQDFDFTFPIYDEADMVVIYTDADGNESVLILGSDYTMEPALTLDYSSGGTVSTTATYLTGTKITLLRAVAYTQLLDYVENDPFPAESHERGLDRLTILAQQIKELADRAIKFPASDSDSLSPEIPTAVQRASKYFGFDASGEPSIFTTITAGLVTITAFAETLLDDANASEMLDTLGLSAFAKTLLDDADASEVLDTLGFSAFVKTLLADADASARRTAIDVYSKGEVDGRFYDLIVDSVADLELLKTGGGGTYESVFIKHGTYSTAEQLDFGSAGVKYLRGERPDTQITLTGTTAPLILLDDDGVYENLTIVVSSAINSTDQILRPTTASPNNTRCRDMSIECISDALLDGYAFSRIGGGIENCRTKNSHRGYENSFHLSNCKDEGSNNSFESCQYLVNCEADQAVLIGFNLCTYLVSCFANDVTDVTGMGFSSCSQISSCVAFSCGNRGFNSCNMISSCQSVVNGGDGFLSCSYISSAYSNNNGGWGFNNCDHISSAEASGNTAGQWNASTKQDAGSTT